MIEGVAEGGRALFGLFGVDVPGTKQLLFGLVLLFIIITVPEGVWPWLARRFGFLERR